jgi:hypothetical protein
MRSYSRLGLFRAFAAFLPGGEQDFGGRLLAIRDSLAGAKAGLINARTGEEGDADASLEVDLDLLKYNVPRCIEARQSTWDKDEEFGRMFLAGQNPLVLEVLGEKRLEQLFASGSVLQEAEEQGMLRGEWSWWASTFQAVKMSFERRVSFKLGRSPQECLRVNGHGWRSWSNLGTQIWTAGMLSSKNVLAANILEVCPYYNIKVTLCLW